MEFDEIVAFYPPTTHTLAQAAAVLGVTNVILMDYEDGMLTSYPEAQLREELTIYIRQYQPDVVMSWYPFPIFSLQPMLGWNDLGMMVHSCSTLLW